MEPLYDRVVAFLSAELDIPTDRLRPEFALLGDGCIDGDDGVGLLERFATRFSVDMSACDVRRHFGPEGLPPWFFIYWLILAFRRGTQEERARLVPIRVADLVSSAELGRWTVGG